jgi:hypothetical protein
MTIIDARTPRSVHSTRLPSGELLPALGQGTWGFAENPQCWFHKRGVNEFRSAIKLAQIA